MPNLHLYGDVRAEISSIVLRISAGADFHKTYRALAKVAHRNNVWFAYDFNGFLVNIYPQIMDDDLEKTLGDIWRRYQKWLIKRELESEHAEEGE